MCGLVQLAIEPLAVPADFVIDFAVRDRGGRLIERLHADLVHRQVEARQQHRRIDREIPHAPEGLADAQGLHAAEPLHGGRRPRHARRPVERRGGVDTPRHDLERTPHAVEHRGEIHDPVHAVVQHDAVGRDVHPEVGVGCRVEQQQRQAALAEHIQCLEGRGIGQVQGDHEVDLVLEPAHGLAEFGGDTAHRRAGDVESAARQFGNHPLQKRLEARTSRGHEVVVQFQIKRHEADAGLSGCHHAGS